jgi:HK97 family phage major capsid protein
MMATKSKTTRPPGRSVSSADLRGKQCRAEFTADRASVDPERRTVDLAFASELPVDRWWGKEILTVTPGAAKLDRLRDGGALLVDHDPRDLVGVVEAARIDADRKARATVRFGRSARADEIMQDVLDGIRTKVSVGYRINEVVLESSSKETGDTYRVTDWQPLEISLVSIPADASVGVGREMDARAYEGNPMTDETVQSESPEPAVTATATAVRDLVASERTIRDQAARELVKRNAAIRALGEKFARFGGAELAAKAELDPGMTFDSFREQLLELVQTKVAAQDDIRMTAPRSPMSHPGMGAPSHDRVMWGSAREMVHAANLQAFRGIGKLLGMDDHQVAYRAGIWAKGVIFGDAEALRICRDTGIMLHQGAPDTLGYGKRVMTEGVFTAAGWLVPVEMETAIIANREQYGVARRICNVIPMGSATMTIPRITSDVTAYFVGENATGTQSDPAGDQVTLSLKDLMAYTQIGKSTAMDAVIPLAEMVAREQARAFAIKEDACLTIGDGTSTYGGMRGINTLLETAAYAGGRATTASGVDTFAEVTVTDTATVIGKLPVYARAGARWLSSGVFEALVFGRLKLAAGGNTNSTLRDNVVESDYAGFPVSVAHNMPSDPTADLTSKVMCVLGNFQLGVAFGSGSGMMMTVDPYTSAHLNLIRIITTERIDIVAHGVNKSTSVAGPIVAMYGNT